MNILPVRVAIDEDAPLEEFLGDVGRQLVCSRRHGRYRSEQLRRDLRLVGGMRRLFGPLINVQPFDLPPKMEGLEVELHILGAGAVDDVTFTFRGDAVEGLTFEADFNPDIYSPGEARNHAERLIAFMQDVVATRSLAHTPTATVAERQRFIFQTNDTGYRVSDTTLSALIERVMRDAPDNVALRFLGEDVTYAELDRRSAGLADQLRALGAGADTVVAVALPRSFDLVIALVGILRAGAAYLPLDPENPAERVEKILNAAAPVALLAAPELAEKLKTPVPKLTPAMWTSVREAAVIVREDRPGDKRIVAYVVPTGVPFDEKEARQALARQLPDYMVPSASVVMDALPLSANGKLDRRKLPPPERGTGQGRAADTSTEKQMAALFAEVLGLAETPRADEDFFQLGGDSLLAVTLMLRIADTWGDSPGLGSVFARPTVAGLAALLEAGHQVDDGLQPIMLLAGKDSVRSPLFIVHPAGGIAWGYRTLAAALAGAQGEERMVWGIQSPMLDTSVPAFDSMEALAADYADRIEAVIPTGMVHLAGWSVGGIIAQAIAVHLRERGRQVGLLAMLDSYPSECWRAEPEPDEIAALRALLAIAGFDPDAYPHLTTREAIVDFLRNGDSALGRLPATALDGVVRVVLGTNRLVRGHYHRRYDGTLTHIRAALDHAGRNLVPDLWGPHAATVDAFAVPFLHPQMTSDAAVAAMAPALRARMKETETAERD